MNSIRKSGLEMLGDIPWGTHISHMYSSKEDFSLLVPYIKAGLLNNELCIWVYSENIKYEEILNMLYKDISYLDSFTKSGQILIIPYTDWYVDASGNFNEVRVNKKWIDLMKCAIDKGYDGVRATGDTFWVDDCYYDELYSYEQNLNTLISELPFLVVCLYDLNKISKIELVNIANNHIYTIFKQGNEYKLIKNVELFIKNKQLIRSEENYHNLLKLLPVAVFIHDSEKIYYHNEAAEKILGINNAGILQTESFIDLISNEYRNKFIDIINSNSEEWKAPQIMQCSIIDINDNIIDAEITATNYIYQGRPAILSVITDISSQKLISKLENDIQKSREYEKLRTEFFCNISHELKTPITIILSAQKLIEKLYVNKLHDTKINKYYKMINQNCYRLLKIVNNILDLTKIDSKCYELNIIHINIVKVVEYIVLSVRDYAVRKDITLTFDSNTDEKIIECDINNIERIVLNLLSNALKFTQKGGTVSVSFIDSGDKITISVKDNGIGIPKGKLKYIFGRFQQVDKSLSRENEGSGIGLSLVKSLVENLNGVITVRSEFGSGSEFIVVLPCDSENYQVNGSYRIDNIQNYQSQVADRISLELSDLYC